MNERIEQEIVLLRSRWPNLEFSATELGNWIRILEYPLPALWNKSLTEVAFQIPVAHPGTPPYGIYTPQGLLYNGEQPTNYAATSQKLPFPGTWWIFSWLPHDGQWKPTADLVSGSNLLNWVLGFSERFKQGK